MHKPDHEMYPNWNAWNSRFDRSMKQMVVRYFRHFSLLTGNISLEIIEIAHTMRYKSFPRELKGTVMKILGTDNSVGCTVD